MTAPTCECPDTASLLRHTIKHGSPPPCPACRPEPGTQPPPVALPDVGDLVRAQFEKDPDDVDDPEQTTVAKFAALGDLLDDRAHDPAPGWKDQP